MNVKTYADLPPIQARLDRKIINEHGLKKADLYTKKKLALLVELGELANELRFFKFWKKENTPRFWLECTGCDGHGVIELRSVGIRECPVCWGTGKDESKNPVLEEYVDCLHFFLSIANETRGVEGAITIMNNAEPVAYTSMEEQMSQLFYEIAGSMFTKIEWIVNVFLGLGEMIGFTEEQIVDAYMIKNKTNHKRQENGY